MKLLRCPWPGKNLGSINIQQKKLWALKCDPLTQKIRTFRKFSRYFFQFPQKQKWPSLCTQNSYRDRNWMTRPIFWLSKLLSFVTLEDFQDSVKAGACIINLGDWPVLTWNIDRKYHYLGRYLKIIVFEIST